MASQVDATVPADNVKADKALLRANFLILKNEITELQAVTSVAGKMAFDDASFDSI